jgi:phage protein D
MPTIVSSVKFPRSNPKKIIATSEKCLKKHDENPSAVPMPADSLALWRTQTQEARALQTELDDMDARKKIIMLALNKTLGIRLGEGVSNKGTMVGLIGLFRDHGQLAFAEDIEQLGLYGYDVKVKQKAAPVSKKRLEELTGKADQTEKKSKKEKAA